MAFFTVMGVGFAAEQSPTLIAGKEPSVLAFDTTQVTSPENGCNPKKGDPCHPLAAGAHAPAIALTTANTNANGSNFSEDGTAYTLDRSNSNAVVCMEEGCLTPWDYQARLVFSEGAAMSPLMAPDRNQHQNFVLTKAGSEAVVCMADDNANAAVDVDLCGTLKVSGGAPAIATATTCAEPSQPGTSRESGTSTSRKGK